MIIVQRTFTTPEYFTQVFYRQKRNQGEAQIANTLLFLSFRVYLKFLDYKLIFQVNSTRI